VTNTKAIVRLEGQFGHLVAQFNRIEEEEFQSLERARRQYMIDEDCPNDSYHELLDHANTFSQPSLVDPLGGCFDQIEYDLDLDKILKQAMMFGEPSLEDPLEESFAQFDLIWILT
jgi:hypothetical protein